MSLRYVAAGALVLLGPVPVAAQIDYRNLDAHHPTLVEDAYAIERYAFELVLPYHVTRDRRGVTTHAVSPELAWGVLPNAHVGLELPLEAAVEGGDTDWGLAGPSVMAFYNVNTEGPSLPAFALRADLSLPVGSRASDRTTLGLTAIATRSWGRQRLHLNGTYVAGGAADARWSAGAAVDHTFYRSSTLLVGEVYVRQPTGDGRLEVNASAGIRHQWRPTAVLDVGVTRGLRRGAGPAYGLTVGWSHAFAIGGLMPLGGG